MTMYSFCKVRGALSAVIVSLSLAWPDARAQNSLPARVWDNDISLSCNQVQFEEVLRRLARQANVHFVYSPNVVETDKLISLSVYNQSLEEILGLIGGQTNLLFRRQGNYVVVKKNPAPEARRSETKAAPVFLKQPPKEDDGQVKENIVEEMPVSPYPFDEDMVKRDILLKDLPWPVQDLIVYDTASLQKYQEILSALLNRRQVTSPWFVSGGLFANDFTLSSVEARAGHRRLYAVINAGLLTDLSYRVAYGVGTSFSLSHKVSVYPIYTYARLNRTDDFEMSKGNRFLAIKDGYRVEAQHHQVKFIAQFKLTPNVAIQLGPTYNMLGADYTLRLPDRPVATAEYVSGNIEYAGDAVYLQPAYGQTITRNVSFPSIAPLIPRNAHTFRSWVGVELGVTYRINFVR